MKNPFITNRFFKHLNLNKMKKTKFPLITLLVAALFTVAFIGCKKDLNDPSLTSNAAVVVAPYTTISFNPTPGVVGQDFTASVTLDPVPNCGKVRLEQRQLQDGTPTSKDDVLGTWVTVAEETLPGTLPLTYTYVPAVAGQVGYRAHYVPSGGQCAYNGQPSIGVNATIGAGCQEGISPQLAGAVSLGSDAKGTTWRFTVIYNINTCGNGYMGKLQGGLISGATLVSAAPAGYTTSATAKSTVLTWSNVSDGNYTIVYTVKLAPGADIPITGAWSFKYPGGQYGYTNRILFGF